jgi:hypothetical protein
VAISLVIALCQEKFEDTKGEIRSCKSKKGRQHNDQKKKDNNNNNKNKQTNKQTNKNVFPYLKWN